MSTSDPAQAASAVPGSSLSDPRSAALPLAAGLPDVGMLTQLANEFFRLVPGQAIAPLPAQPGVALPFSMPNPPTGFGTQPPQFGAAAPPVPSADKVPSEADDQRLATAPAGFPPEISSVTLPTSAAAIPASPALLPQYGGTAQPNVSTPSGFEIPAQTGFNGQTSPFSIPLPPFDGAFPAIDLSLVRIPAFAVPANDEKAKAAFAPPPQFTAPSAIPDQSASPFSLPLPGFERSFSPFDLAHPEIPALPPLLDEDAARAALTSPSQFYFLPDAGTLSQPVAPTTVHEPGVVPDLGLPRRQFDVASVRRDFPILNERVNGHPLIWLDNAATTQKPQSVIDRISYFYEHENSNIHRAAHELAARATDAYEDARQKVANFLNASSAKEIVFVRGATEAINLVAQAWGRRHVQQGDEIIVSQIEHHANIVPWQMLAPKRARASASSPSMTMASCWWTNTKNFSIRARVWFP
jgi:cysteine desulfurase/selenocysteine lyase